MSETPPLKNVPTRVVPQRTKEQEAAFQALEASKRQRDEEKQRKVQGVDRGRQWYVRCDKCDAPGLMLSRHPEGMPEFQANEWFATYKALESPYMSTTFPCQNCKAPLKVTFAGEYGCFFIDSNQMGIVDSAESRQERKKKADADVENFLAVKSMAGKVQIVGGSGL